MSKEIWHTKKEKATEDKLVFAQHKSLIRDRGVDWFIWEPQEFTDAIREDVIAWTYLDDLLALEAELERTRKALEMTDTDLAIIVTNLDKVFPDMRLVFETIRSARKRIAEITALEQGGDNGSNS